VRARPSERLRDGGCAAQSSTSPTARGCAPPTCACAPGRSTGGVSRRDSSPETARPELSKVLVRGVARESAGRPRSGVSAAGLVTVPGGARALAGSRRLQSARNSAVRAVFAGVYLAVAGASQQRDRGSASRARRGRRAGVGENSVDAARRLCRRVRCCRRSASGSPASARHSSVVRDRRRPTVPLTRCPRRTAPRLR
jgi:hypothetical protein